jgi:hypothetical protein
MQVDTELATWIALLENQTQPPVQSVTSDFAAEIKLPEANCYFILFLAYILWCIQHLTLELLGD